MPRARTPSARLSWRPIEPGALAGVPQQLRDPARQAAPPAVAVEGLGKLFRIPQQAYSTLRERVVDRFRAEPPEVLQALKDVSFEVGRGEFFGVAGRSGSGKSTLLRCIAGIYDYDEGVVRVSGRLAPFVELGVGFNPELNARDNAVLNARMLGLNRREANARAGDVLAFAGLEDFAEMQLRNFSSGMRVRLAFSVAVQVDASVLLVDEVLAVGDAEFQAKCFERFEQLKREGRTVVLVTHDMEALRQHCDRALLLEGGRVAAIGAPEEVAARYAALNAQHADDRREIEQAALRHVAAELQSDFEPAAVPASYRPSAFGDDLRRFGDITVALAVTEYRLHYLDSALGYLWSVMRPLLFFTVLYFVFGKVTGLGRGVEHYPVYLLTAIVLWTFFTETAAGGVTSLKQAEGMMRKLRFPRLSIPLSIVLKSLFNLGVNALVVVVFVVASGLEPRLSWLQIPGLVLVLALFAAGVAMLLSAAYARYRDTAQVWGLLQQALFFASPILYVATIYPGSIRELMSSNPLAAIFIQVRHALIDPSAPSAADAVGGPLMLLLPAAVVAGVFALGLWFFNREAPRVAERL